MFSSYSFLLLYSIPLCGYNSLITNGYVSSFGNYEQSCYKHLPIDFCRTVNFNFCWVSYIPRNVYLTLKETTRLFSSICLPS